MTYPRRQHERTPTHPGYVVGIEIEDLGLTITDAARRLGVSRRTLSELVNERRSMSPEMALRLGRFLGNGTELWMNLQTRYDLWAIESDPEAQAAAERIEPAHA